MAARASKEDNRNKVIELFKAGLTQEEISSQTGYVATYVGTLLRKEGLLSDRRFQNLGPDINAKILHLSREGLTHTEISEQLDIASDRVYRIIHKQKTSYADLRERVEFEKFKAMSKQVDIAMMSMIRGPFPVNE